MSIKIKKYHKRRLFPRRVPVKNWDGILVIHKGLTAIVHGCLIDLDQDHERRVATVCVRPVDQSMPVGAELDEVKEAADLLADRAKRFLGRGWNIIRWNVAS